MSYNEGFVVRSVRPKGKKVADNKILNYLLRLVL
jgi:hypothetical protein